MRPREEPSVIEAAALLATKLGALERELARKAHPVCGSASVFIGQIHSGEIYNSYPHEAFLEGTRRWLPGSDRHEIERDFRARLAQLAEETATEVSCEWFFIRDAFALDPADRLVSVFRSCFENVSGAALPFGPKPFVDDGNSFTALGRVPAITHGPRAGGQHTVSEWVEIDDLVRIATLYAAVALAYCDTEAHSI
jgi:acetylornithine deacetylase/succinyl-diaminopimelate desuccinylase-like protein